LSHTYLRLAFSATLRLRGKMHYSVSTFTQSNQLIICAGPL
jgi:hypothetical protein